MQISVLPRIFDLYVWNFSKIRLFRHILFRVWNIATISEFPIQSLLYYFTQVRLPPIRGQWSALFTDTSFCSRTNKLLITVSVWSYCLCITTPRVYPIRATAGKINIPRTALNIFPRLRVRNCLLRVASGLRNTRTPLCSTGTHKAGDITGSSLTLEYWISSAASSRKTGERDYGIRPRTGRL